MQQSLDMKEKVMSNMASVRDASNLVTALINQGLIKTKDPEEIATEINWYRNKFKEWHIEDLPLQNIQGTQDKTK